MINKTYFILPLFLNISCGYPDIDDVPNFKDVSLSSEEVINYCNNIFNDKDNIDNCINDYKNKK